MAFVIDGQNCSLITHGNDACYTTFYTINVTAKTSHKGPFLFKL